MDRLLRFSLARPRLVLGIGAVVTLFFAAALPDSSLRTDGEMLRPLGDSVVERDALERERFRDPRWILLLARARQEGDDLANTEGLRRIRDIHRALRRLDVLAPDAIRSLAAVPRLSRDGGGLIVAGQLDAIPTDEAGLESLLAEFRARPWVEGLLFSADQRSALYALPLRDGVDVREAVSALEAFVDGASDRRIELLLGGPLLAETTLGDHVLADLATLVPIMVVVMALLLAITFRCPGGVLIPLIETGLVLTWTLGAMAVAGVPIALVTTILPVVLMAMCISDEIHLLECLLRADRHRGAADATRIGPSAISEALAEVGRPIVLTSLTTAAGFLSFCATSIVPLRHFGLFAAFGILLAMLLTFSVIPALILVLPTRWLQPVRALRDPPLLMRYARWSSVHPRRAIGMGCLLVIVLSPGLARLRASDSWVENFAPDTPLVRMERALNAGFWGSYRLDVIFTAAPGYFRSPEGVALLEAYRAMAGKVEGVGGVQTLLDALEVVAERLGVRGALSSLDVQRLWDLFTVAEMTAGTGTLHSTLIADGSVARARIYVRSADYERALSVRDALDRGSREQLPPGHWSAVEVVQVGELAVATRMVEAIVRDQLRSVGLAILLVAAVLFSLGGGLPALVAIVPVVAATLGLLASMGALGVPLGIATSMFASLSIGLGVDFGIHFSHGYRARRASGQAQAAALVTTFARSGRALCWNAAVLSAGFSVLMLSRLPPNHALGLLLSGATLSCVTMTFLFMPWLLGRISGGSRAARGGLSALPVLVLLGGGACGLVAPAPAGAAACPAKPDAAASALMRAVEESVRSHRHLVRTHVETHYEKRPTSRLTPLKVSERTLWSAADGRVKDTHMLFVFTAPGRMAGTSLLLRDRAGGSDADETWFYLRAFDHFERLEGKVESSIVPGTALSYEDARGFIAGDRYDFSWLEGEGEREGTRAVLGCPRTPEMADRLGYGAIQIVVDPARLLVERIDYQDLGGGRLKRYEVKESVSFAGVARPTRVRLVQWVAGFENRIHYEYWPMREAPESLFRPVLDQQSFLERMVTVVRDHGVGARIDAELAIAESRVRAYEEARKAERK